MYSVIFYNESQPTASMRHKLFKTFSKEEFVKQMPNLAHNWDNFFNPGYEALNRAKTKNPDAEYFHTAFRLPDNSVVLFEWFK